MAAAFPNFSWRRDYSLRQGELNDVFNTHVRIRWTVPFIKKIISREIIRKCVCAELGMTAKREKNPYNWCCSPKKMPYINPKEGT